MSCHIFQSGVSVVMELMTADGVDDALQLVMKSRNKNFRHTGEKTCCCMNHFKFDVIASAMIMDELINRSWKNVKLVIHNDGLHLSAWQFLPNAFNVPVKTMRACGKTQIIH